MERFFRLAHLGSNAYPLANQMLALGQGCGNHAMARTGVKSGLTGVKGIRFSRMLFAEDRRICVGVMHCWVYKTVGLYPYRS